MVLPTHLKHKGEWAIAPLETPYPHQITNFMAPTLLLICPDNRQSEQKQHHYSKPHNVHAQTYCLPRERTAHQTQSAGENKRSSKPDKIL